MKKDNIFYLSHICDAIDKIEFYLLDKNKELFEQDSLLQDGLIRQLEIIGEASKKITSTLKRKYSKIPWKQISGMRDKLIHDYFGVDLNAVWLTVQNDIKLLKNEIKNIIISEGFEIENRIFSK